MDIRNFRTFSKIAEFGSFTKAADVLGYAQSTLTFQMQAIESHYDQPVFEKIGRRVQLTDFGKRLLERVDVLLREYEQVEQLGKGDVVPQGSLRIGAPESLMMYRLYPIIKSFKSMFPQVELSVINDPCELLLVHLCTGQLDLSFLLQPNILNPNLHVIPLREEKMCLVAPAGHSQEDMLPEETQMVLYTEKECTYQQEYNRYLQHQQYSPVNILETASVEAIKKYVINGLGVSYLPYYSVIDEVGKDLLRIKFPDSNQRFFTQIAYHKKKWLSPAMRAFLDLCIKYRQECIQEDEIIAQNDAHPC